MAKDKKNKMTSNGRQNATHWTKDWATRTPLKKTGLHSSDMSCINITYKYECFIFEHPFFKSRKSDGKKKKIKICYI